MLPSERAEELKGRARAGGGEAFIPVLDRDGLRLGPIVAERCGRTGLCLEALMRLLPAGPPVDLPALESKVKRLGRWVEMGYSLQHFDGEWAVAMKRSPDDDVQRELEQILETLR